MPRTPAQTKKLIQTARDRFELAQKAEKDQRRREREDIEFYNGDQWPEEIKNIRKSQNATNGMPAVPARPMVTINKTRGPVTQVLNQERQSDMGIEIVPADDFGDLGVTISEDEIYLREGLTRRIQRESKAADARTWAFKRGTIAGRGFYVVMTRYAKGKTNDQEIYVERIYNQSSVTIDPAHEQPDGSDAEWGFIWADVPWDVYKAEYGRRNGKPNRVVDYDDSEWRNAGDERPEWFVTDGDRRTMRVGDYWYTDRETRELVTLALKTDPTQERLEWADELDNPELAGWVEVEDSRRTVVEKRIKWCKIDGCDDDVLDETDWAGPDMPIVKVLGEELLPSDGKRCVEGMVRPMREPCYGFNVMVSRWIEVIGLAPLVPVMVEEGTIEGYEDWWQLANTRTLPYLPYKRTNLNEQQATPPSVPPSRNPPIEAIAGSVQMFDQSIQDTSGHPDVSLGKVDPSVKSGRAIKALQEQAARSSNHYLDNLQRSIRYEGQIINNLLYPIYGRAGRIARILNPQGDAENVLLHQPMVRQGDRPVPAAEDDPHAKHYTLTKDASFNVIVKVSKSFDSRREQEVAIIGDLLSQNPELMTWFGDLFFQNQDGPGHQQMAERAKVMLAPPIQQMIAAKMQGKNVPPEVQAQLASAQQQVEQLQAELQKASKPTAVEEVRQQGENQRTHLELLLDREKMHVDSETKIAVAELGAKVDRLALFLEERARLGVQQEADAARGHDVGMAAMGAATEADEAERERQAQADEAERARQASSAEAEASRQAAAGESEASRQHEAAMAERAAKEAARQAKAKP